MLALCITQATQALSNKMVNGGRWTDEEHKAFLEGMKEHGRAWKTVSEQYVKTRNPEQVRIHAQKHYARVEKMKRLKSGKKACE